MMTASEKEQHMIRQQVRRVAGAGLIVMSLLGTAVVVSPRLGAQAPVDLNSPDSIRVTLEAQLKKRVRVKLVSGQDLEGQVAQLGSHAVLLTELAGMEFYDATVRLDQIAAVVVRRAGR
jgi:hypothetical protein